MDTASRKLVWAFVALGFLSVLLTFYKSVILEEFTIVYCDGEGNCYRTMPDEWVEDEMELNNSVETETTPSEEAGVTTDLTEDEMTEIIEPL
jgi:hypothetical protein